MRYKAPGISPYLQREGLTVLVSLLLSVIWGAYAKKKKKKVFPFTSPSTLLLMFSPLISMCFFLLIRFQLIIGFILQIAFNQRNKSAYPSVFLFSGFRYSSFPHPLIGEKSLAPYLAQSRYVIISFVPPIIPASTPTSAFFFLRYPMSYLRSAFNPKASVDRRYSFH